MNRALHPEADAEFLETVHNYAEISPQLGGRFFDEVSGLMHEVCTHPSRYRALASPVKRILAHGSPYAMLYVAQANRVRIIEVMHLKRHPGYWKHRLPS